MRRSGTLAALLLLAAGSVGAQAGKKPAADSCPPPPADSTERWGRVFIDGRRVGANLRLKANGPMAYDIIDPEPAELAKLPVSRIDLVQYDAGPEAEVKYGLCPEMVAILITTKPAQDRSGARVP